MEEKTRISLKLTLGPLTTLWDLKQFAATALQVMDRPELMVVNDIRGTETGAGRMALVAAGTPRTTQEADTSEQEAPKAPGAPKVPNRITEWPEDDEHLRAHSWQDQDRDILSWVPASGRWVGFDLSGDYVGSYDRPQIRGPWTRVEGADR